VVNWLRSIRTRFLKARLISALRDVVELLDAVNERQWAFRLRGDLERLEEDDGSAVDHLLSAYGGMGSFNDLYICEQNGHKITADGFDQVNRKLRRLSTGMWILARGLNR
jgi:hypothetical protein